MTVSALELAEELGRLRYWVRRHYGGLSADLRDELVAETALGLLERHRRAPELRAYPSALLKYAAADAYRRLMRPYRQTLPLYDWVELADPPNQFDEERLRERLADELAEDAAQQFARADFPTRRAREDETRSALGSSPLTLDELAHL